MIYRDLKEIPKAALVDIAQGCLLGGAIGDALGAPVEFMSLDEIRHKYGPEGIQEFDKAYGTVGAITDDTQMTLFSAEGLIRAKVRFDAKGICAPESVVAYAYQRWLWTQGEKCSEFAISEGCRGWLVDIQELHSRRAPGVTCLSALRSWDQSEAKNDSKGCGTVMRSAPFGFMEAAAELAWKCAEITHGHIEAKVSAAIFAQTIQSMVLGHSLENAILEAARLYSDSESTRLILLAIDLSSSDMVAENAISRLGQGWTADEALAIGVYCASKCRGDFELGVRMAINHDGDSDSTGSICGNLLGVIVGYEGLPSRWRDSVELVDVIVQIAIDLVADLPRDPRMFDLFHENYPGC